jgi:beta-carotene isomerase
MTPILPPFYRIFMSGIIPKIQLPYNNNNITIHAEEKQYGPWFYAPFLTSYITPIFFKFLVGPSYPNRHRATGSFGGLLVTKCKFLQESNCKGLCLHQCKIPAQNFFNTTLGLSLNVVPNFVTQECQWNFNEMPITPVSEDPSFPMGCLRGCTSRMIMNEATTTTGPVRNICN